MKGVVNSFSLSQIALFVGILIITLVGIMFLENNTNKQSAMVKEATDFSQYQSESFKLQDVEVSVPR